VPIGPINPPPAPLTYAAADIIRNALTEIGALSPGEDFQGDEGNFALSKANDLLDEWSARKNYVYADQFLVFTLVPSLSPHLIGPVQSTFVVPQRPIKIVSANLILNTGGGFGSGPFGGGPFGFGGSNPIVDTVITIRDEQWWNEQSVKFLAGTIPTDLYYEADWPNGSIFFWPVPSIANNVRLELWTLISQFVTLQDSFSMPPAYRKALTLSLAETLLGPFQAPPHPELAIQARAARAAVFGNNTKAPRMESADSGIPTGGRGREIFNYRNRSFT
jgi:hypothetical protein